MYELIERRATAATLHALTIGESARPEIWWQHVTSEALVLGSTQHADEVVDRAACSAAGVDVVQRRSGGGAVLLVPGEMTWIDVIVPAGAPGWAADVHAPMRWIGAHLAAVLAPLLAGRAITVHGGGMVQTAWSSLVCFDGLGPGEVSVDGHKLIGISQRRTRAAARLQCSWYHAYEPDRLTGLLAADRRPPHGALRPLATVGAARSAQVPTLLRDRLAESTN